MSRAMSAGALHDGGLNASGAVGMENLGGTAEGVNTIRLVKGKSVELEVYMPLVHVLYEILFEEKSLKEVIQKLMLGEQNTDVEFVLPGPDKLANLKRG